MRLYVVYDDQGTIFAATQVPAEHQTRPGPGEYGAETRLSGFDVPLPKPDEHAGEFDVPGGEYNDRDLPELMSRLQVDIKANRLVWRH
jgi:hypothetical protein